MQNNFGKLCHCSYHALSLREQCNRLNYIEDCISCDNTKKKVSCNARTCNKRKKLFFCRSTQLNEGI